MMNETKNNKMKRRILIYCMKRTLDYLQRWRVKYASCGLSEEENKQCYDTCSFINNFIKNNLK